MSGLIVMSQNSPSPAGGELSKIRPSAQPGSTSTRQNDTNCPFFTKIQESLMRIYRIRWFIAALMPIATLYPYACLAETVGTAYGSIKIKSGVFNSEVYLNGKSVKKISGAVVDRGLYHAGSNYYILLSIGTEAQACPTMHQIVDLSSSGVVFTKQFGTCGGIASVSMRGQMLKIVMNRPDGNGVTTYFYHGGKHLTKNVEKTAKSAVIIKMKGMSGVFELTGEITKINSRPYFYMDKVTKIESENGVIYTNKIRIYSHDIPRSDEYGAYVIKLVMPMAGPMITEIHKY
jgi:hypothetical protein